MWHRSAYGTDRPSDGQTGKTRNAACWDSRATKVVICGASTAIWTQVNAPRLNTSQTGRSVLDLHTPEGWKAELTLVVGYILRWFTCPQTVTSPELQSVTCHMGSHSVICHSTQVNAPHLNPGQTGWYLIYLPRRDERLS